MKKKKIRQRRGMGEFVKHVLPFLININYYFFKNQRSIFKDSYWQDDIKHLS